MNRCRTSYIRCVLISGVIALIALLATAGCVKTGTQGGGGGEDLIIRPAPIQNVVISIGESLPRQVFARIEGGLPDGCTNLREITKKLEGATIEISITTERLKDTVCTQVYRTFTQSLNLGSDFVVGQTYRVKVNEVAKTFVMQ